MNFRILRAAAGALAACLMISCSSGGVEGKYRDANGNPIEFFADGTLIAVTSGGEQIIMKWATYDGNRMKLEGRGLFGSTVMCGYEVSSSALVLSGCPTAMDLTRL